MFSLADSASHESKAALGPIHSETENESILSLLSSWVEWAL